MNSHSPLFGNNPSDLMRAAAGAPLGGSAGWQPPAPEVLQAMLPGFEVQEFIARGGMGAVYRGEQISLARPVAIKIMPPELLKADPNYAQRFKQEARAMAQLNHPGIVSVYDFGEMPDGTLYFIMEFIDGTDVGQMVVRQGRLSSTHSMAITAHVCDALQYAHEHGVVHRDIKPANIMVGYDGRVKVADFGLAKSAHQTDSSLTVSGHVMGTPHFVAPEALTLGVSVDHRADIYAVGVMLYQMLTGRLPQGMFEMPSLQVQGLDPRYDAIVAAAMRDDRDRRYQSVREMRRALDAIVTQPVQIEQPKPRPGQTVVGTSTHQRARPGSGTQRQPGAGAVPAPTRSTQPQPQAKPKGKSSVGGWVAALVLLGVAAAGYFILIHQAQRKTVQLIEGESLATLSVTGGKPQARYDVGTYPMANWSGGAHLWWTDAKKGDKLTLKLPVAESGRQRLRILFPVAGDGGIAAASLDGQPLPGSPFDLQAPDITLAGTTDCGVWDLKAGDHELSFELLGTHGRKMAFGDTVMGIDCIRLEPVTMKVEPAAIGADIAPRAKASASYCSHDFNVSAINDGREPSKSGSSDQAAPHQTWFPRQGGMEWVQYEWDSPQVMDECQVFWFDDTRVNGGCKLPLFWRLCYREASGAWVPVDATIPAATLDKWDVVKFPAIKTTALRIAVQCHESKSSGMCHWKVLAADPASVADPKQRELADLSLSDLPPLRYQVGWGIYHVNYMNADSVKSGQKVVAHGKPCSQFLWAHADSRIEFAIPEGYTRFKSVAVADTPVANFEGTWKCLVLVDGVPLLETEELSKTSDKQLPVDVVFPRGSKQLTLLIDPCDNKNWDNAYWASPTLIADGEPVPSPSASATAAPKPPVPVPPPAVEDKSPVLQYVSIMALDRRDAAGFLSKMQSHADPSSVLSDIHGMAKLQRTRVVANMAVTIRSGYRCGVLGAYGCASTVIVHADGTLRASLTIRTSDNDAPPKLEMKDLSARRGQTCFLGSFEDGNDRGLPVRLAFVTFR